VEFIAAELGRAVGLGGRDRRTGSNAERARVNTTRAIRTTIKRIGERHPRLGSHLEVSVKTGIFCSYDPDPESSVSWEHRADMS